MNVRLNKILSALILSIIIVGFIPTRAYAADASLSVSKNEIKVGEVTKISASISSAEAWTLNLTATGGNLSGTTESTDASDGETSKVVLDANFSSNSAGTYTITLTGEVTGSDLKKKQISKTVQITVKEEEQKTPEPQINDNEGQTPSKETNTNNIPQDAPKKTETKSRNYYLSSLSVKTDVGEVKLVQAGNENAGFNRGIENYVVVFPEEFDYENFDKITISATAEDSKSKISGTGEVAINEGDNNFEVRCTAEDGSAKTYTIRITKPIIIKESELKLNLLQLEKINQNGESEEIIFDEEGFNSEVLSYNIDVESDINALLIKLGVSKIKDQDIIVKINEKEINRDLDGNLEDEQIYLDDGVNTIRITLISPLDENVSTDYVLTVNKEAVIEVISEVSRSANSFSKGNLAKIIIGVIIGIILLLSIILIILIIINKKQKKQAKLFDENNLEEDNQKLFDYNEEDTYLNDKSLEKLNKEYEEKANKITNNNVIDENVSNKASLNNTNENNVEVNKDKINNINEKVEDNNINMKYENLSDEERQKKLDELLTELKSKNKGKNK